MATRSIYPWEESHYSPDTKKDAQAIVRELKYRDGKQRPRHYKIVKTKKGYTIYTKLSAAWNDFKWANGISPYSKSK